MKKWQDKGKGLGLIDGKLWKGKYIYGENKWKIKVIFSKVRDVVAISGLSLESCLVIQSSALPGMREG